MNYILFIIMLLVFPFDVFATYSLPNDDAGCPDNCRVIPWSAGSDQWNNGTLPSWSGTTCTGLTEGDGTTNNASAIQTCINAASANSAVLIPAGIYYVNSTVNMRDNVVLRGSGTDNCSQGKWLSSTFSGDTGVGAVCTTLKLGTSGALSFNGSITKGSEVSLSSGYTKGSYTITVGASHGLVAGDWVVLYEHPDTDIPVTGTGVNTNCDWCGESDGTSHFISMFNKVSSVSGNDITLLRPMYYTFKSGLSPALKEVTFGRKYSGIEHIKVHGWSASRTVPIVTMSRTLYSWMKDVELYMDTNTAKGFPVFADHAHGGEIRDSYIHGQRAQSADRAYGIGLFNTTSDWKIENNIIREQRHCGGQEGGGAGNTWLYNYIDDCNYLYDTTWFDSSLMNHGAHPIFTLVEGSIVSKLGVDFEWGSSSHGVWFRNHLWGDLSGNYSDYDASNPNYGFMAARIDGGSNYYSMVGNILGKTGLHTTWSGATFHPTNCSSFPGGTRSAPIVYAVGCDDDQAYTSKAWTTLIKHGNYDYKNNAINDWDGGADHTIANSLYYNSQPGAGTWWCTETTWPPVDPTGPTISDIPAKRRYDNTACTLASGSSTTPTLTSPVDNEVAGWPLTFSWSEVTGALSYHLQVDNNSSFTNCPGVNCPYEDQDIDPDAACDGTDCYYIVGLGEGLQPDTHYYWRVRAAK